MPRKKRILIIIHLCFAFTYFFWLLFHPYLKQAVFKKSQGVLFESVIGSEELFAALPVEKQEAIKEGYETQKRDSMGGYFANFSFSLFATTWMVLSLVLCFFLLFQIEGAAPCCWALPMLIMAWGYFLGTAPPQERPDFFPTDAELAPYVVEGGKKSDRERLVEGWYAYLIAEKLHETPVEEQYERQVERGNFLFNLERVHHIMERREGDVTMASSLFMPSALQFVFYIVWNFAFAWLINRRSKSEARLGVT